MLRPAARAVPAIAPLLALVVAATAAAATRPAQLHFTALSKSVLQGGAATVKVELKRLNDRCALSVAYKGRPAVRVASAHVTHGRAQWRWAVPKDAPTGAARVVVSCTRSGKVARSLVVVGVVVPPRVTVVGQGFSFRPASSAGTISYGVVLKNDSAREDALGVTVQVNFVDAANVLQGTSSQRIDRLQAGQTYNLGGQASFPAAPSVSRLEVVVQMTGHAPRKPVAMPAPANIRIVPGTYDPRWVQSVEGELANDQPQLLLGRATLSAVLLDAGGSVVGGGTGYFSTTLPPGARAFFTVSSGLSAIQVSRAASVQLSIVPTWLQPGS